MKTVAAALITILGFAGLASADPILRTTATTGSSATPICGPIVGTSQAICDNTYTYVIESSGEAQAKSHQIAIANASYGSVSGVVEEIQLSLDGELIEPNTFHSLGLIAEAEFTDILTISGDVGQGFLQYVISGTALAYSTNFMDPDFGSSLWLTHDGNRMLAATTAPSYPIAGEITWDETAFSYRSPLLPFNWNQPFELNVFGRGQVSLHGDGGCCGYLTATLDGFRVFNANQQRVNSYSIASEANAPYATAVPEPATLLLCAFGLAGGYARRRWTHRGH